MGDPQFVRMTKRHGRRVGVTIVGVLVVLVGLALCVLPGPGLLVLAAGLAILATEYVWARRLLERVRAMARQTVQRARGMRSDAADRRRGPDPTSDTDAAA
jgi:uncharacterized protein (TIGR02611 family)